MIKIKSLRSYYLEFPLIDPVITSFGVMKTRPCIIIELEDFNKNIGYGEIWCYFPSDAASYRFNLLNSLYLNNIIGCEFSNPEKLIDKIADKFKTLFVQSGDIISEPATTNLKFNEGKSTKTVFGGIVSLLMIVLLGWLTV